MFWNKNKNITPANAVSKDDVLAALKGLKAHEGEGDIVEAGMVSDIFINGGSVIFSLTVDAREAEAMEAVREMAEAAVSKLAGVEKVMVALTAERKPGEGSRTAPSRSSKAGPGPDPACPGRSESKKQ